MIKTEFMELYEELESINEELKTYRITYYEDGVKKSFTVQAGSKAEAEQIGWSRVDADSLYVSEEITEATDFNASKTFWADAKAGRINDAALKAAYGDELTELGLWKLFDYYGMLKAKGSYGQIKKAAEEHPDSWAVKAILKVWVLQFNQGVKSDHQLEHERQQAEWEEWRKKDQEEIHARWVAAEEKRKKDQEEYEKRQAELKAKRAAAIEEQGRLVEKIPFVQELVNKLATEYTATNKATFISDLEKIVHLQTEVETATRKVVEYDTAKRDCLDKLRANLFTLKVDTPSIPASTADPRAEILVTITSLYGERLYANKLSLTAANLQEEIIKKDFVKLLDDNSARISKANSDLISKLQKEHDEILRKVDRAKAVQAAVNAGRPADPAFISELVSLFKRGLESANDASDMYSDVHDVSSGAAFYMRMQDTLREAGIYLVNCNWRAIVDEEELATWQTTNSEDELYTELKATFQAAYKNITIEIFK